MIYVQVENHLYKGRTFKTLVQTMYATSFDEAITKKHWMFNVQERIKQLYDKYITVNDHEGFIRDLDKIGLIRLFKCGDCDNYNSNPRYCIKQAMDIINPETVECSKMDCKEIRRIRQNEEE